MRGPESDIDNFVIGLSDITKLYLKIYFLLFINLQKRNDVKLNALLKLMQLNNIFNIMNLIRNFILLN